MNKICLTIIILLSIGLVVAAFLIGFSFSILKHNNSAILYNKITKKLDESTIYTAPGSYFIGVQNKFIYFPTNNILVSFSDSTHDNSTENITSVNMTGVVDTSLKCWTRDGMDVVIELNFYYTLNQTNLIWFYREFGDQWRSIIQIMASKAIKERSVAYPSSFFYINRTQIQTSFRTALQAAYDHEANYSISISYFQIQFIMFPGNFESSIVQKLIQQHYYNLYNYQGQINLIQANTTVYSNNTYNKINLTLANATALGIQNNLNLTSIALVNYLQNMTVSYENIRSALGLNWTQMYPLIYAIELKTGLYLNASASYVPKTLQRVMMMAQ